MADGRCRFRRDEMASQGHPDKHTQRGMRMEQKPTSDLVRSPGRLPREVLARLAERRIFYVHLVGLGGRHLVEVVIRLDTLK
jgi:hypothetical protein